MLIETCTKDFFTNENIIFGYREFSHVNSDSYLRCFKIFLNVKSFQFSWKLATIQPLKLGQFLIKVKSIFPPVQKINDSTSFRYELLETRIISLKKYCTRKILEKFPSSHDSNQWNILKDQVRKRRMFKIAETGLLFSDRPARSSNNSPHHKAEPRQGQASEYKFHNSREI